MYLMMGWVDGDEEGVMMTLSFVFLFLLPLGQTPYTASYWWSSPMVMPPAHPLLAGALQRIRMVGSKAGLNIVAYSGGVDSSLVAALLYRAFPQNTYACIGKSSSSPCLA